MKKLEKLIEIPKGVTVSVASGVISVKGPKGESKREIKSPKLRIESKDGKITINSDRGKKKDKMYINSYNAHIKEMINGALGTHRYVLKVCASHFPMNVSIANNSVIIKNFIGEKNPRVLKIKPGASVKIEGDKITVESADKELSGTVASDIEQLTYRPGFDTRIFQDGIYIIEKDGKEIK